MPLSEEELGLIDKGPEVTAPDPVLSVDMASRNDPERSAEVFDIANKRDIPTSEVEPHLDEFKRLEESTAVPTSEMGKSVLDLINNPDTGNIVHDDLRNLVDTEKAMAPSLMEDILGVGHAGIIDIGTGMAGAAQAFFEAQAEGQIDSRTGKQRVSPTANFFGRIAQSGESKAAEVFPEIESEYAGSAVSGVRSAINFMALMGATGGAALIPMATQAGGLAYHQAREQDLDVAKAVPYAVIQGGIEFATEKIPMNKLLGDLADGSGFVKTIKDQMLTELPTEQVATIFQDLNDWAMLPENEDKPFMDYVAERPNAALQTAIATAVGTSVQTTAVYGANRLLNRDRDPVATGLVRDAQQIAMSEAEQERLDSIITLAQESKVSERSQDVYKKFLEGAGSEQSVFLPADILQDLEEIPPALAAQMDGLGGDIEIPMDVFMAEIAKDDALMAELRPHLKMGADQLSASEIEQGGEMTVRRLLERAQANADIKTEADEVFESVRGQLESTGRVTKSEARLAAQLYPAVAAIQAERYGISPAEVFERMGLTIEGPGGAPVASTSEVLTQTYQAYRGEHGDLEVDGKLQTRNGSITFSGQQSASGYAMEPNNNMDDPVAPRVYPAKVTIDNPVMNDPDDPFIDFTALEAAVGFEQAKKIFMGQEDYITETDNWYENFEGRELAELTDDEFRSTYSQAFPVFDNAEAVEMMRKAGYDGAVHGGYGEYEEAEFRIFSPGQAVAMDGTPFTQESKRRGMVEKLLECVQNPG